MEQSQQQLLINLMLNTGPGCINRVSADGTLLQVNPRGLRLIEADQEKEAIGLSVFDLVVPEHRGIFEEMHQAVLNGTERTLQFKIIGLKGTRRWLETYAAPFRNPITNQVEHLAVTHDISDRKQAESSLEFFHHLIAQTDDALYWLSPEKGFRFVYVNEAACRHYGYSREELRHMAIPDWDPNFPLEACGHFWQELKVQRSKTFESLHQRKNGKIVPVEVTANYVAYDSEEYIAGTIKDISARKQSEVLIQQLLRQNQLILDSAGEGIYGLDANGLTTFVNPAAARMLGYEPNDLIGMPMHTTMHHTKPDGSPYPTNECPMYAAFRDGSIHQVDTEVLWRKNGTSFPVEYTSTPIRDDQGKLAGAVVTFRDITKRKRKQAELEDREERVRRILDTLPTPAYTFNTDGSITYFNRPAVALWARTPKLNDPEDRFCGSFKMYEPNGTEMPHDHPRLRSVIDEAEPINGQEVIIERPDGTFRSVLSHANPLRDASGQVVGGVNVLFDITETNKIQKVLELSERSIRTLYDLTSSTQLSFEEIIRALLQLGCHRFGLPIGTLTKRRGDALELEYLRSPDSTWVEHDLVPICESFCGNTFDREEPVAFEHAGVTEWANHPGYRSLGLEAYLGTRVLVGDTVYGSLCFLDRTPYEGTFTKADRDFLQLMARWIGFELERQQSQQALRDANDKYQTLSRELLAVQERERRQLARDLHDELGQTLTALKINLQSLQHNQPAASHPGVLADSLSMLDYMLRHVRELSLDLRPSLLDDLGLAATLRWYVKRQAERAGWRVNIQLDESTTRLPLESSTTCFRVIQEALTNVMRHAKASEVQVRLTVTENSVDIWVKDNGLGFNLSDTREQTRKGRHFGLLSMEERVELLHGNLSITSQPGNGTHIHVRIPLPAE